MHLNGWERIIFAYMSKETRGAGEEHAMWKAANEHPPLPVDATHYDIKIPTRKGGGEIDPSKIRNIGGGIYDATVEMPALTPEQLGLTEEQLRGDKTKETIVSRAEMSEEEVQQLVDDVNRVLKDRKEILLSGEAVAFNFQRERALGDLEKLLEQDNVFGDPDTKAAVRGVVKGLLYGKEGLIGLINEKVTSGHDVELIALLNQITDI